jgi:hypothetical protein
MRPTGRDIDHRSATRTLEPDIPVDLSKREEDRTKDLIKLLLVQRLLNYPE